MRSNKIFKRVLVALLAVAILAVLPIIALTLEGNGAEGHAILLSGSGMDRIEVLSKDGKTLWRVSQTDIGWSEVNDADMLPNGNIVLASRASSGSTVYMLRPDYKKGSGYEVLWTYKVPAGAENHTSQVLPDGGILIGEAYASYVRIVELDVQGNLRKTVSSLEGWPAGSNSHSQVRQIYKTEKGTYLLASMSANKTIEYSADGEKLAEYPAGGFTAICDKSGNVIVAGGDSHTLTAFDSQSGEMLWRIGQNDIAGVSLGFVAALNVLDNGNILLANWGGHGGSGGDAVLEIALPKDGEGAKVVWSVNSGSATSNVCLLDGIDSRILRGEREDKAFAGRAEEYRSPVDAVGSMMTDRLYVADETNNTIEVINTVSGVLIDEFKTSDKPNTLLLSPNAKYLYVAVGGENGRVEAINVATGLSAGSFAVGHTPSALAIDETGEILYVANRFNGTVQSIALTDGEIAEGTTPTKGVYVTREPMSMATRDGKIYVGGHLPTGSVSDGDASSEVVVLDTETMTVSRRITMVSGSTNLKDIALSPDGEYLYVSHALGRWNVATTHVDRGWIYTNAITEIRTSDDTVRATVLVDDLDLGAANPWGIDVSDRVIALSVSGTREMMILDRQALRDKIEAVYSGKLGGNGYLETPADISVDLTFTTSLKQRIRLGEDGPRGIEIVGDKVYTANYFGGSVSVYDMKSGKLGRISLETSKNEDMTRGGERLWNDATICMGQWQSCASCHPDGRVDGLNWDNMNDGIGTPKQARSMVGSWGRGRVMATGIRESTMAANRAGLKYICFNAGFPESEFKKIDAYTENISAEPSPYLVNGQLSESALRGKALFEGAAGCIACHSSSNAGADVLIYENFTRSETETRGMLVPPLVEAWRTAPYLHDGSAATILDVLTTRNLTGTHGNASDLSESELEDLCNYVLSFGGDNNSQGGNGGNEDVGGNGGNGGNEDVGGNGGNGGSTETAKPDGETTEPDQDVSGGNDTAPQQNLPAQSGCGGCGSTISATCLGSASAAIAGAYLMLRRKKDSTKA